MHFGPDKGAVVDGRAIGANERRFEGFRRVLATGTESLRR
jgi:hypothetical protein